MSERDPSARDERVILEAESTEAFVERRRFQDLFEARRGVLSALRDRPRAESQGVANYDISADLHAATRAFVLEAKWLFEGSELGRELWTNRQLGPVDASEALHTPEAGTISRMEGDALPVGVQLYDDKIHVEGVRSYADLSSVVVPVRLERELNRRGAAVKAEETYARFLPPRELSEQAFAATDELLAEPDVLGKLGADDYRADEPGA
jgi:hypothetical protein